MTFALIFGVQRRDVDGAHQQLLEQRRNAEHLAVRRQAEAGGAAVWAVMLAMLVHAGSKSATAGIVGGWRYLAWLAPGLWLHMALGAAGIYWMARA